MEKLGNLVAQANVDVRVDGIGGCCRHDQSRKDKDVGYKSRGEPTVGVKRKWVSAAEEFGFLVFRFFYVF